MNVILLDRDFSSLNVLENMLIKIPHVKVIKKYTNPIAMIEEIKHLKADILFLEVDMKEIHGLSISEKVSVSSPHVVIVFVATNSKFALQAFDVNATDFLLKPLSLQRLQQTFLKIRKRKEWFNHKIQPVASTFKRQ